MVEMLDKLISCCIPKANQKRIKDLIRNEEFHYVEPRHKTKFIDRMWDLGQAVSESRYIEADYYRTKDRQTVYRKLKPVAILFSVVKVGSVENITINGRSDFTKKERFRPARCADKDFLLCI